MLMVNCTGGGVYGEDASVDELITSMATGLEYQSCLHRRTLTGHCALLA